MAKPTALAMPCPSGPVVVSIAACRKFSGWPAVIAPHWRKFLISSSVIPGEPVRYSSEYSSMEPCPADRMNRSRPAQSGAEASNFRCFSNRTVATSAMPIGMPECPELAACTASSVRARMAAALVQWSGLLVRRAAISTGSVPLMRQGSFGVAYQPRPKDQAGLPGQPEEGRIFQWHWVDSRNYARQAIRPAGQEDRIKG